MIIHALNVFIYRYLYQKYIIYKIKTFSSIEREINLRISGKTAQGKSFETFKMADVDENKFYFVEKKLRVIAKKSSRLQREDLEVSIPLIRHWMNQ